MLLLLTKPVNMSIALVTHETSQNEITHYSDVNSNNSNSNNIYFRLKLCTTMNYIV